jgi:hypothetical protein
MILRIIVVIAELVVISKFRYVAEKTDTTKHRPLSKKEKKTKKRPPKENISHFKIQCIPLILCGSQFLISFQI